MFLIGGDKDEQRRLDLHDSLDHGKAVKTGHLNVEEHKVGLFGLDLADRLAPNGAGVDDLHVQMFGKAQLQALNGQFFVINENGANGHGWRPAGQTRRDLAGIMA